MRAWKSTLALFFLAHSLMALQPCPASAADDKELARQHYKKASQLYDIGRFDEALAEYEQAYSLRQDPSLLFNMAQACRRKGDLKRALDLYKNFLVKDPETPMRAEVESRIKGLKAQIEQGEKPAAEPAPVIPPPVAPSVAPLPTATIPASPAPAPSSSPMPPPLPPATVTPFSPPPPSNPPPFAPTDYPPGTAQVAPPTTPYQAAPPPEAPAAGFEASPASPPFTPLGIGQTAPAPSSDKETGSSGWPLMIAGSVVTAGGLVCLGLGIYNAVQTKSLSDKVSSAKTFNPNNDDQGKRAYKLQWIEGGIGIGAVAVGATLFTIGALQHRSHQSSVAVVPLLQTDGAMLAATGGF